MMPTAADRMDNLQRAIIFAGKRNPDWRFGQTVFNVLASDDIETANKIRGTSLDPFHNDARVASCLAFVLHEWEQADQG